MTYNRYAPRFKYRPSIDLRILITLTVLAGLALSFWLGSRYPALDEKALMGADTPMSGLAFDILLDIMPDSSIWWQFLANTANWIKTNLKGMTFGVLFGAVVLTLLSLIKNRSFKNGFANAALGAAIGAPLGVCVNCAAPIALGLHMGRTRLETTLAALIASPTLNVVVVTMSFTLLPFHIAATKLILATIMVLLVIPLLCRYVLLSETEASKENINKLVDASKAKGFSAWIARALTPGQAPPPPDSFFEAALWFVQTYSRNLFFIALITVPMMFLAAMLGASISMVFSSNAFIDFVPSGAFKIVLAMGMIALIASFAPAPIALDVILTASLLALGLGSHYGAVLVIALGSYSVYAFIIIWRAISLRTAIVLWLTVIAMSVAGGLIAYKTAKYETAYDEKRLMAFLDTQPGFDLPLADHLPPAKHLSDIQPALQAQTIISEKITADIATTDGSEITVNLRTFNSSQAKEPVTQGEKFSRIPGDRLGFEEFGEPTMLYETAPHMMLGGIAAGDVHNDGWIDIIVRRPSRATGFSLYANVGGRYVRQNIDLGPLKDFEVGIVALADLDNDGWLDIVVSTLWNGVYIFPNAEGDFSFASALHFPPPDLTFTYAIAFADINGNGHLDIILGDWVTGQGTALWWGFRNPENSQNRLLRNEGNFNFQAESLAGSPGQTLTLLVSDFNTDGQPDILKGNDVAGTDEVIFYEDGQTKADLTRQPFSYFMHTSMSYDSGDWNNDLRLDYYGGQASEPMGTHGRQSTISRGRIFEICQQFAQDMQWDESRQRACPATLLSIDNIRGSRRHGVSGKICGSSTNAQDATLCAIFKYITTQRQDLFRGNDKDAASVVAECNARLARWPFMKPYCDTMGLKVRQMPRGDDLKLLHKPALSKGNILMTRLPDGSFDDRAGEQNVKDAGWTWNSRFTDLDQDGWQDLLVSTGIWLSPSRSTSNKFYHNDKGAFSDKTENFGLFDLVPSFSFAALDYDRDGDIDIIRPPDGLTMIAHRNDTPAGSALWVHLEDHVGNRSGVGARVTICTDGETEVRPGKCQIREIKASGGFMAFDPIAAHFGLGDAQTVSLIDIVWRDGEHTKLYMKDLHGGEVFVSRAKAPHAADKNL